MSEWKTVMFMYLIAGIMYLVMMAGVVIGICLIVKWIFF